MLTFLIAIFILLGAALNLALSYRDHRILYVTFSPKHARAPETRRTVRRGRLLVTASTLIAIILSFLVYMGPLFELADAIFLLLTAGSIAGTLIFVTFMQRRLERLKKAMNWVYPSKPAGGYAAPAAKRDGAPPRHLAWLIWALSLVPLLFPLIRETDMIPFWLYILMPLILLTLPLAYPAAVDHRFQSTDPEAYQAARRRITGCSYLLMALSTVLFLVILAAFLHFSGASGLAILWPVAGLITALLIIHALTVRRLSELRKQHLDEAPWETAERSGTIRWGFYHNADDPRLFVPKPIGIGVTINTARPAGRIIALSTISFVAIVLLLVIISAFFGFSYELSEDTLKINAVMYSYSLTEEDVVSVERIASRPSGNRTNGFGGMNRSFGHFRMEEYGAVRLYSYNHVPSHVVLELTEDHSPMWILLNEDSEEATEQLYQDLRTWLAASAE